MKIGILTYHFAVNYGAALQALALKEYLCSLGHETSVVDYCPKAVAGGYRWFDISRFWGRTPGKFVGKTLGELRVIGARRARYRAFAAFRSRSLDLAPVSSLRSFDLVIIGSDQVWNTGYTKGFDPLYWGEDSRLPKLVASYAASFGGAVPAGAASRLSRLVAVSVREKSSLEALAGSGARCDLDPVFLLPKSRWASLADESKLVPAAPYLLFYQVKPSLEALEYAREEAYAKGLQLVCLSAKLEMENSPGVIASGPSDFIKLFRDASEIVTTSFHGTAFSLIFEKEFKVFKATGPEDTRIEDLLLERETLDELAASSREFLSKLLSKR